jgi:hypothetical protein
MSPAELLDFHDHIETCPDCRESLAEAALERNQGSSIPMLERPLEEPGEIHLLEEEMVAWVAKRTPEAERNWISDHLESCSLCRESVAAMRGAAVVSFPAKKSRAWFAGLAIAAVVALSVGLIYLRRPQAPPIVATLQDAGGAISLNAVGELNGLSGASAEEQSWVRDALSRGTLPAGPAISRDVTSALRSPDAAAPAEFSLIAPVGIRVLDARPTFSWQPDPGATDYEVVVTNESLEPVARSGKVTATEWQPATPLPRGGVLLWQVRASRRGAAVTAPQARLEIASAAAERRIGQLRAAPNYSHLLAAAICAHEGLSSEAATELEALAQQNPGSPLVESLGKNR